MAGVVVRRYKLDWENISIIIKCWAFPKDRALVAGLAVLKLFRESLVNAA